MGDMAQRFDAARGKPLRREPRWRPQRDRCYGQPARQQVRAVHVANIWGTTAATTSSCKNL